MADPKTTQDVITDNATYTHSQPVENLEGASPIEAVADLTAVNERLDLAPATSDPPAIPTFQLLAKPASLETVVGSPAIAPEGLGLSPASPGYIDPTSPAPTELATTNAEPHPAGTEVVGTAHPSSSVDESSQNTRAIDESRLRVLEIEIIALRRS